MRRDQQEVVIIIRRFRRFTQIREGKNITTEYTEDTEEGIIDDC
jgi:hypothetical protein